MADPRGSTGASKDRSPLFSDEFLGKIERLALAARRGAGSGAAHPYRRGGRLEFADHRHYAAGDDLRYVDWHLYGRLGQLFLKEFAREQEAAVLLVLDASASMARKLRGALRLSAALLTIALARGDRVRVAVARDGGLEVSRALAGEGRRADLLAHLAGLDGTADGGTDLDRSLAAVPPARGGGRRLFLLVSDLLAESDGRSRIAALRGDRVVFHWLDAVERVPPALGLARLVSAEGGSLDAWVGDAEARRYAAECERWMEGLRAGFGRHGVRYLVTPAERPVEDLVLDVLVKEGVVE